MQESSHWLLLPVQNWQLISERKTTQASNRSSFEADDGYQIGGRIAGRATGLDLLQLGSYGCKSDSDEVRTWTDSGGQSALTLGSDVAPALKPDLSTCVVIPAGVPAPYPAPRLRGHRCFYWAPAERYLSTGSARSFKGFTTNRGEVLTTSCHQSSLFFFGGGWRFECSFPQSISRSVGWSVRSVLDLLSSAK